MQPRAPISTEQHASDRDAAGLRIEVHDSPASLSDAWDALADRVAAAPFVRPGWVLAWWRAFGKGKLRALTALRDGELVGLLPFAARRGALCAPVNWHTPLFGFLATDKQVGGALARSFVSGARLRADLALLDASDPQLAECRLAAEQARRAFIVRTVMRSPYVHTAGGSWEGFLASLERKARRDVERRRRRLQERGDMSLDFQDGRAELDRLLREGFRLEGSGWKHERGSAILSEPHTHGFYTEIARWASERGWLLLAFLRLDGRPIAFDLCLECGGVTYVLKGGFDPEFRRFAPGMVLTYESLRRCFEHGNVSYELLGVDAGYKLVWTRTVRERVRFQAFARSPAGRAEQLAWTYGRAAARRALTAVKRVDPRRDSAG